MREVWGRGAAYESYVGRWSRRVAQLFVRRLDQAPGRRWLDVGCGTGALTATILELADPAEVIGVDTSEGFVSHARSQISDSRAGFRVGDAQALPLPDDCVDVVVSGLALNFVPDPALAVAEFARVTVPSGMAAAYVWDYTDGMVMMRYFWDAAAELDAAGAELDEGRRFSLCHPEPLSAMWSEAGFSNVSVEAIEIPTVFDDFDDFWTPFLGGQGAAPAYAMSLSEQRRTDLRELLRARLPANPDGSIALTARVWAVRGTA